MKRLPKVKQEFISASGFSVWGKKRTREVFKPSELNKVRKPITDIIAEL